MSVLFAKTSTATSTNGHKMVVEQGLIDPGKLGDFLDTLEKRGDVQYLAPPASEAKPAHPSRTQ